MSCIPARGGDILKTLYIGNLPWSTTDEELAKAFNQYVEVKSCRIITDRATAGPADSGSSRSMTPMLRRLSRP
jgi:RNA recognition motif-containing protein